MMTRFARNMRRGRFLSDIPTIVPEIRDNGYSHPENQHNSDLKFGCDYLTCPLNQR